MASTVPPSESVRRKVEELYSASNSEEALRLLESYVGPEADRVRLAALRLAGSNLRALRSRIDAASSDYRDLLAWAEFPRQSLLSPAELKARTEQERREIEAADREGYEAWLRGPGRPNAKRKVLKSVVRSFVDSFTSLLNYHTDDYVMGHLVQAAWRTGATRLTVDLLTGRRDDSGLLVPPVRDSIDGYVAGFPDLVRRSGSRLDLLRSAELVVTVDPDRRRRTRFPGLDESPFTVTVRVVDDRGREYAHTRSDWWFPESPPGLRTRILRALRRLLGRRPG